MKTFEEIEAAIAEKEADHERTAQILEATKGMAADELAKAEEAIAEAKATVNRKAFDKATALQWEAELKLENAQKELDAFTENNSDELIDIECAITDLSCNINEEAAAMRKKIHDEIAEKVEEYKAIENKITSLYSRLGVLQHKPLSSCPYGSISAKRYLEKAMIELR